MESPVTIRENGAIASVHPELGGWLVRYARPVGGRELVEVIHRDEEVVARYPQRMWAGNPVLFPHVSFNWARGLEHHYEHEGRLYHSLQHGFSRRVPWTVTSLAASVVTMELTDSDLTRPSYPWSFRTTLEYRLAAGRLHWTYIVENRDATRMPFSAGFHPYLSAPLTAGGVHARCHLRLPAATRYVPAADWGGYERQPSPAQNLSLETDMSGTILLGDLAEHEAALVDVGSGLETVVNFAGAPGCRFLALWARSAKESWHCIEPWTALPNSFGRADGEVIWLAPGGSWRGDFWLDARDLR